MYGQHTGSPGGPSPPSHMSLLMGQDGSAGFIGHGGAQGAAGAGKPVGDIHCLVSRTKEGAGCEELELPLLRKCSDLSLASCTTPFKMVIIHNQSIIMGAFCGD